jgi:hypothetical protein
MKKVLFAAFAGLCVMSSIMATSAVKKINSGQTNQLRDTVPPKKDTSKFAGSYVYNDTVPPKKDTSKFAGSYAYSDTVPPKKDTSKFAGSYAYSDTVPPKKDTSKIARLYRMKDTVPTRKYDTTRKSSDTAKMPRMNDVAFR